MTARRTIPIMMLVIIMIGFFLRLYGLGDVPLRGDEAFTVQYWARQPLADSLAKTATIEPHPVLTYALFRGWGLLAGTTAFTMRFLPALANMLGIPALYIMGCKMAGRRAGLLAALLFALHPFEIWHSQDARNYAIWAGASAVTLALGLRALKNERSKDWFLYGAAAAITVNIFYFEWLTLAAFGVYILIAYWRKWAIIQRWILASLPALLTSGASFLILQGGLIASGGYSGTMAGRLDIPLLLNWFLPTLAFGDRGNGLLAFDGQLISDSSWLVAIPLVAGVVILWRRRGRNVIFVFALGFIPLVLLALAASRLNIFNPRYILSAVPAYILALAVLGTEIFKRNWVSIGGCATAIAFFLGSFYFAYLSINYINFSVPDYTKSQNWPALTQYLRDNVTKRDLVIQLSVDAAFGYYYDAPADAPALPEKPSQPADDIRQILERDSTRYRSIWIVGQTFADWPNAGVVENWLDTHMQSVRSGRIDRLQYHQYMPWQVSPDEIQEQPLATFGELVELVGAQVFLPPNRDNDLTLWLYWKPLKTSAEPLKVFVHLVNDPQADSPVLAQEDHSPMNDTFMTTTWDSGTIYRDIYILPVSRMNIPAGTYSLTVGFYTTQTERLPVGDSDHYTLQNIELK